MRIGAHISTRGGFEKMATYAQEVGCETIQMFTRSPQRWTALPMPLEKRAEMQAARKVYDFGPIMTHGAYLINMTTDKKQIAHLSKMALVDELVRGSIIEAEGVNIHLGNVPNGDRDEAVARAARRIGLTFELVDQECEKLGIAFDTRLVLENSAGMGTSFGNTVTELCKVVKAAVTGGLPREKFGICIDTCHAWAYGYDVQTREGWQEVIDEFKAFDMLDLWQFGHANDCKFGRGSRKDRHAWIGEGDIGFDGFKVLLGLGKEYPELDAMCLATEMPGEEPAKDIINIEALKALRDA